ncbi:MAG: hypothetical protein ABJN65_01185 [Parasphingorhabdus sp.]
MSHNFIVHAQGLWSWWSDEMLSMTPEAWRGGATPRDRFDMFLEAEETILEIVRDGDARRMHEAHALEDLDDEGWSQIAEFAESHRVRLFLTSGDFLEIPVTLPKASSGQLRSAINLQLPTLSPIVPDKIDWNFLELGRTDHDLNLSLIIARSTRLDELESIFALRGLMPPQICVQLGEQIVTLRKPLELSATPVSSKNMLTAGATIGMLCLIPITTIAGANVLTSLDEDRIARLEKDLAPKLAQEREAQREEKIRRAAAPLFNMSSASNRLEALAIQLPETDWAVVSSQGADGGFEFVADMANREVTEDALRQNTTLKGLAEREEIPTESARTRVRYRIGS